MPKQPISARIEMDLFEHHEHQPPKVANLCDKIHKELDSGADSYKVCAKYLKKLERIGYTFEYYLDGEPFNLTKTQQNENSNKKNERMRK